MIITLSVMPPNTYLSLSLAGHGAITILYNIQLFVCPANDNATCVPCFTGFGDGDLRRIDDPCRDLSSS
jgi:hypothetical protein